LGPVLPAPLKPSSHEAVQKAIEKLTAGLDAQTSKLAASGLSIGVKSIHEDKQLFSYHFTPNVTSGIGTSKIDENTIYRVGSISKMMPAITALQNANINFDDSILKYIPELRNATNDDALKAVAWEDITVGSLANHLSGLATDCKTPYPLTPFLLPWDVHELTTTNSRHGSRNQPSRSLEQDGFAQDRPGHWPFLLWPPRHRCLHQGRPGP
jgi:CubicO group peptidase (beta-lactamase class C family)